MMSHRAAREVIREAWALRGHPDPTLPMLQLAQAVGHLESGYGSHVTAAPPAHNWGSTQATWAPKCPAPSPEMTDGYCWPCPPGTFDHLDTDEHGTPYQGCFTRYDSDAEGAADMLREILRRPGALEAMQAGSSAGLASALRNAPYPPGAYFAYNEDKVAHGYQIRAEAIAKALDEPLAVSPGGSSPRAWLPLLVAAAVVGGVVWWQA